MAYLRQHATDRPVRALDSQLDAALRAVPAAQAREVITTAGGAPIPAGLSR